MQLKSLAAALAAMLAAGEALAQARTDCQRSLQPVTELGSYVSDVQAFDNTTRSIPVWARENATRYLRLRIRGESGDRGCEWLVTIRDEFGRIIQTVTRDDFRESRDVWTLRVFNRGQGRAVAYVDLDGCPGNTPQVSVQEFIEQPPTTLTPFYSKKGAVAEYKELHQTGTDRAIMRLGDAVGMLVSSWIGVGATKGATWSCSGVMITDDLFLTNWHCGGPEHDPQFPESGFWSPPIREDTFVDLSWDGDDLSRDYFVTDLAASSMELDYAILRVKPLNAVGRSHVARLSLTPLAGTASITIIHHPEARVKQVSTRCGIVDHDYPNWKKPAIRSDFSHSCDTEGGSSGAPVFNDSGEVIGIQHLGYDRTGPDCRVPDGGSVNKAVRIDEILNHLRCKARPIAARVAPAAYLAVRDAAAPCVSE